jgi:protein-S-isoprenylcysteine O-methyltransferase Ste14
MKTSMTLFGCGPKLALLCLPYVILSLIVMYKYPEFFDLRFLDLSFAKVIGFIWLGLGVIYWMYSAIFFLKYFKPGNLITAGPFFLCRNPIYSSIIVFIIPSLALIFHSGLIISISLVLYIGFKISIHGETIVLRRTFGEQYEIYEKSVNEIIPSLHNVFKRKSIK